MVKRIFIKDDIGFIANNVSCIGYFDGIHLGHQELINKTIIEAKRLNVKSSVICFELDTNLISNIKNKQLFSYHNRLMKLEEFNLDQVIVINFDKEFMNLSPLAFIDDYLNKMNIIELICGFDYSFGYMAKGNSDLLTNHGDFKTIIIDEKKYLDEKVSSTRIKNALIKGDFSLVKRLLGYTYYLDVKVINCLKQADKYLIEAILFYDECILPNNGKYLNNLEINDNKIYILCDTYVDINTRLKVTLEDERIILAKS